MTPTPRRRLAGGAVGVLLGVLVATLLFLAHRSDGAPVSASNTAATTAAGATPTSTSTSTPTAEATLPPATGNPFAHRRPYTWPDSAAAQAVGTLRGAKAALMQRIADTPTAIWLTPETQPAGSVGQFVSHIVADAAATGTVPVFVVYGITDRDCSSGQSAGGLAPRPYLNWVSKISAAAGPGSVAILEPDALASAPGCGNVLQRERLLSRAVQRLQSGPAVYLDAGHSNWIKPADMAAMLEAAGLSDVRGFAVNVSSYGSTSAENAYARALRARVGKAPYVIDTSRNGRGNTTEWCNPTGQALGHVPAAGRGTPGLDAYLWVKPPGESDGSCNGGPPAGQFWVSGALRLARTAGW